MQWVVKKFCSQVGIRGDGAYSTVSTHGLKGTIIELLIESVYDDMTIHLERGIGMSTVCGTTTFFVRILL